MRTLLSQFCEEFEGVVRPLLDPLHETTEVLSSAGAEVAASSVLPTLRDLRHQLSVVADKVGEQQAYVLIFGPLKSGKSTLMNAMAAAYVSEVTSLPAYPCMNYVTSSEAREFVVTRYDGSQETFSDLTALRMVVNRAHTELSNEIRRVEEEGERFDAQVHYPSAIRRIDVKVPAGELDQSGAVLVDTPGLYTRMKFGYDRMTREFRDTAACAIFVVKSENLFLEQVFEEFNELLSLFSRIFLVVNLDTTKQDLRPDGTLAPSLECEDPVRIIEAFENLAMSAPLKAAAEEGRLRIYPVDLLRSASRRILSEGSEGVLFEGADQGPGQADFETFLGDLTEYLNSTDYLVAFLGDSIRRANLLLTEIQDTCRQPAVQELERQVRALRTEHDLARHRGELLGRLHSYDWNESTDELRSKVEAKLRERGRVAREATARQLVGTVEAWFQSDASLHTLLEDELTPLFDSLQRELVGALEEALDEELGDAPAGLDLNQAIRDDLGAANIDLSTLGRIARLQIDSHKAGQSPAPSLDVETIPVRRSFWDWILFRTQATVRRRLFGPGSRPTARIATATKARSLGDPAREVMRLSIEEHLDLVLPELSSRLMARVYGSFATQLHDSLREELNRKADENKSRCDDLQSRLNQIGQVRDCLHALELRVSDGLEGMTVLSGRYGETQPEELAQPVAANSEDADDGSAPDEAIVELEPFSIPLEEVEGFAAEVEEQAALTNGVPEAEEIVPETEDTDVDDTAPTIIGLELEDEEKA